MQGRHNNGSGGIGELSKDEDKAFSSNMHSHQQSPTSH